MKANYNKESFSGFGVKLSKLMERDGIASCEEMGRRIGVTGRAVAHWLYGRREPNRKALRAMHDNLGWTWEEIMYN